MSRADAECTADKENRWSGTDSKTVRAAGGHSIPGKQRTNELRC